AAESLQVRRRALDRTIYDSNIFLLFRRQRLQPVDEVERFAGGQLVGADLVQQGIGGGCRWGRLRVAAGGAEEREVVGEPREGTALLALFEHAQHLLGARRHGLGQASELGDMDAVGAVGGAGADLVQKDDLAL